jgi:hypothetical protein
MICLALSAKSQNDTTATTPSKRHHQKENPPEPPAAANNGCCCIAPPAIVCADGLDVSTPATIAIDFRARNGGLPSQSSMKSLQRGQAVRVLVYNYNPYLYQVVINHSDSTILAPQSLTNFATFLDPSGITAAASQASTLTGPAANNLSAKLGAQPALYSQNIILNNDRFVFSNSRIAAPAERIDPVVDSVQNLYDARTVIADPGKTDVAALTGELVFLKSHLEPTFYLETKLTDFLYQLTPDCEHFTKANIDHLIQGIEADYNTARQNIADTRAHVTADKNDYLTEIAPYIDFSKKNGEIRFSDSVIKDFYLKADAFLTKCDSIASFKQQQTLISFIKPLQELSTCYQSLPLYFTSDIKTVSVQLIPWKDSTARVPAYQTQVQLPWQQSRTWGVSAGIFCSTLHDKNYGLLPSVNSAGDTVYNVQNDKIGNLEFGIDVLAYTGWNVSKSKANPFYLGVTFGAGSSISANPQPRVLLGFTGILGDKNRLAFAIGVIGGYTQTLSSLYTGVTNFAKPTGGITKEQLNSGGFLSISYSFLNGN